MSSPRRNVGDRLARYADQVDDRLGPLTREAAEHKRAIRYHRAQLQEVAAARRRLIEKMQSQFGIEVVLVDADGTERGVEGTTHGRKKARTQTT